MTEIKYNQNNSLIAYSIPSGLIQRDTPELINANENLKKRKKKTKAKQKPESILVK